MRRFSQPLAFVAAAILCSAIALPALASDSTVENSKGVVSYQVPQTSPKPIAPNASIALADRDFAITGDSSLATITLPDSTNILVGSLSKVQMAFFNQAQIASAKFVIYNGRVRFAVRHPKGAQANYRFVTPTGTIGVRGTQGDIEYDANGSLRVNVYEVCDPNEPVVVTTKTGQRFTVVPGQSLIAQIVNGQVQARIEQLTQQLIDQFSPDFGIPTDWDAAKGEVIGYAQGQTENEANRVTDGIGGQYVPSIGGLFHKKVKPAPMSGAASSTCQ
ncbi:MAG: FecR family protein [Vulcanimicrobiaceae bacterium]